MVPGHGRGIILCMNRRTVLLTLLFLGLLALPARAESFWNNAPHPGSSIQPPKAWIAGVYAFSDERGGFRILSVEGMGTRSDPIVIRQQFLTIAPATLIIRAIQPRRVMRTFASAFHTLHIRLITENQSAAAWIGYEISLQEELGKPSIYGDGLSFDQLSRSERNIVSDRFLEHIVEYEPGDSLFFNNGWVDLSEEVEFNFFVLDLTPVAEFYIVQQPYIPAS